MQLHDLQPKTDKDDKKRVGRGGSRGKTCGRGHKGQLARAGGTPRPQIRDRIKKLPKLRGYDNNPVHKKPVAVNVGSLADVVEKDTHVTPQFLVKAGLIQKKGNRIPPIKILGEGDIDTAVIVAGCEISDSARKMIEAAGGDVK
ncbi:MAG: 50S ribosomal protein L15 [Parcubacteria group bacterium SW_6_46_9]|nr:MAG: 50S ribosomal protein L15 [Parcubacteria group bacterium SW_6_46_9]